MIKTMNEEDILKEARKTWKRIIELEKENKQSKKRIEVLRKKLE